ncbi:MAG: hypothetical protein DMF78_22930 [Acidobacteria bacterium]|nr:MAG: hypothetical protein DMF78_22930 [Acidobacteriota bacterium]
MTPTCRRRAILFGAALSVLLASTSPQSAWGSQDSGPPCPAGDPVRKCAKASDKCCPGTDVCASADTHCCGPKTGPGAHAYYCHGQDVCCGAACCPAGQKCVAGACQAARDCTKEEKAVAKRQAEYDKANKELDKAWDDYNAAGKAQDKAEKAFSACRISCGDERSAVEAARSNRAAKFKAFEAKMKAEEEAVIRLQDALDDLHDCYTKPLVG